ncbi:MAG: hypothetical protein EYC62_03525 [Alphaproteobacteria bacterium]|nr:MAG: hypothetical protein EYC62_03525 [Alphaproteobacteria bacterium]
MVHYQSSLEEDGVVDTATRPAKKRFYPAHQDPKKITLAGQPTDVVERGLNKLRNGIAQQVGAEFNKQHGRGWRSSEEAPRLQEQFSTRTAALFEARFKQLTNSR